MANQEIPITFKSTLVLYYALLVGQILICIILSFLVISEKNPTLDMSFADIKQLLVLLLVPAAIMISHYLYSNKIREGKKLNGFKEKISHFRASSVMRWSLLEGVNLINLIFFFLSGNYFFLITFSFGFLFFLLARPSENGFIQDYKLDYEEKQAFKDPMFVKKRNHFKEKVKFKD